MSASAKPSFPSEIFRGVIENDALRAEINLLRLEIAALRKEISGSYRSDRAVGERGIAGIKKGVFYLFSERRID